MTVAELEARMDSAELNEWMAHYRIMDKPEREALTISDPDAHSDAMDRMLSRGAQLVDS